MRQLGDILLEGGLVTMAQLQVALEEQQRAGRSLGRVLVDMGAVTEAQLVAALATQIGLPFVDLTDYPVDSNAVVLVADAVCRRHNAMPIGFDDGGRLIVAMADPANVFALDDIRSLTGREVKPVVATKADLIGAINRYHRMEGELDDISAGIDISAQSGTDDLDSIKEVVDDAPIVRFVNLLITQAIQDRASDIHIEPAERDLRVRFRIDGVLHEVMRSPKTITSGVVSRLKIMADMDIAERRVPQDGRLVANVEGRRVDVRVVTLPLIKGEGIVMRILDMGAVVRDLDSLRMSDRDRERFVAAITRPYGAVLVTGPTGSGKSTTLYGALGYINDGQKSILTIEDPVESQIPGVRQMQVAPKRGVTFATGLRSMLRADPDVIMVGEIRDPETAETAVQAALTGHLVLSTLHTRDAPSALARLTDMGVEPFMVAAAIDCVVAQRLARTLCSHCKRPAAMSESVRDEHGLHGVEAFDPAGCIRCGGTGYDGRLGLYEVMPLTDEIRHLALERRSAGEIAAVAHEQGMRTMRQDGIDKVRQGLTSLVEVGRVTSAA